MGERVGAGRDGVRDGIAVGWEFESGSFLLLC